MVALRDGRSVQQDEPSHCFDKVSALFARPAQHGGVAALGNVN